MFTDALENDLKTIFKVKAVRFEKLETCTEQGVLCAELTEVRIMLQRGEQAAKVSGFVGIKAAAGALPPGWLSKCIRGSNYATRKRFWFSRKEDPVHLSAYEWELKGWQVPFVYFFKAEYNPPRRRSRQLVRWAWNLITGAKENGK